MAKPTTNPIALAAEKTRLAKRWRGSTGSTARRSASTKRTPSTTPAAARPIMNGDPHAYEVPPRLVKITRADTDAARRAVPR